MKMKKDIEWLVQTINTERESLRQRFESGKETVDEAAFNDGRDWALEFVLRLIDNLEQDLPVIPKHVTDWWERDDDSVTMYGGENIDKKRKIHLISNFNDMGLGDYLSKVEDWIDENVSAFLDLVNGKPYEVEEEQKYYTLDSKNIPLLERRGDKIQRTITELNIYVKGRYISRFELTEQEIKDYDPRYWPFAVEVAE